MRIRILAAFAAAMAVGVFGAGASASASTDPNTCPTLGSASITNAPFPTVTVDYAACPGNGTVEFSPDGLTTTVKASIIGQTGATAVWKSRVISHTDNTCVSVNVTDLTTRDNGSVQLQLDFMYNNLTVPGVARTVTSLGTVKLCGSVPRTASTPKWALYVTTTNPPAPAGSRRPATGLAWATVNLTDIPI